VCIYICTIYYAEDAVGLEREREEKCPTAGLEDGEETKTRNAEASGSWKMQGEGFSPKASRKKIP
jgi:hypothetical protein